MPLHTASFDEIRSGQTTDVYFERTQRIHARASRRRFIRR